MRIISFDVFDTLLTRTSAVPHDLFVRLGSRLRASGIVLLDDVAFADARSQSEHLARRKVPHGEVPIGEIYRELGSILRWDFAKCAAAESEEIALEEDGLRPVALMKTEVQQARQQAGRVVFISDTYFSSALIQRWLEHAGFWQPGDLLFVSNEFAAAKGHGTLYGKIRAALDADYATWTHHGDNGTADVVLPRRLGITAHPRTAAKLTVREERLRGRTRFAAPWRSLLVGASRLSRLDRMADARDSSQRTLSELASGVVGPLFYGFVEWCLAEAEQRGIEDLYFVARGGQVFLRIAHEIQAVRRRAIRLHYLQASRLALIADIRDPVALRRLATPRVVFHSARQAFGNLGLQVETTGMPPGLTHAEWEQNLPVNEREALADWLLLEPARLELVQAAMIRRAKQARAYLDQQGLVAGKRLGLVDTGWKGTIHRSIEELLSRDDRRVAVSGFYLGLISERKSPTASTLLGYTNAFFPLPLRRIMTHCILLELLSQADHGQVIGYEEDATGRMVPQYGFLDEKTCEQSKFIQDSVVAFTRCALQAGGELAAAPVDGLARATIDGWAAFQNRPTRAEVMAVGRMPHSDQMLEQRPAVLCPDMRLRDVVSAMANWRQRPPGWWLAGQAVLGHAALIRSYMVLKRAKWKVSSLLTGLSD